LIYERSVNDYNIYCDNYDKVNAKLAFFFEEIEFNAMNSFCGGAAIKMKKFFKGIGLSSFLTERNSFVHEMLNEFLDATIPAGIPQYLLDYHMNLLYKKYEPNVDNEPKILTVDDLAFGFVLWAAACGCAFLSFCFELLKFCIGKTIAHAFGLCIFARIWKWRAKMMV
jgi:hypothetical protein